MRLRDILLSLGMTLGIGLSARAQESRLACIAEKEDSVSVKIMDVDGSNKKDIELPDFPEELVQETKLVWSPNNKYIVLKVPCRKNSRYNDIGVVDVRSGNLTQVTTNASIVKKIDSMDPFTPTLHSNEFSAWLSNGRLVNYSTGKRENQAVEVSTRFKRRLRLEGRVRDVSPDGRFLTTTFREDFDNLGSDLLLEREVKREIFGPDYFKLNDYKENANFDSKFSPNGRNVAFSVEKSGTYSICCFDTRIHKRKILTGDDGTYKAVKFWISDTEFVYTSSSKGEDVYFLMNVETGRGSRIPGKVSDGKRGIMCFEDDGDIFTLSREGVRRRLVYTPDVHECNAALSN